MRLFYPFCYQRRKMALDLHTLVLGKTMEVNIQHLGNSKFEVLARGHRLICDQPRDNGGSDAGMAPPEFLLASLATCAGYYAAEYLKTRALPAGDLRVRVVAEKAQNPARLGSFR